MLMLINSTNSEDSNSSLVNISCSFKENSIWSTTYFQVFIYICYTIIFIFAILGNGMVCYLVLSNTRMRTKINFFIVTLAIGDILMAFFCIPFSFVSMLVLQYWPFGIILCKIVNFSQAVSVLVSAYTFVAISLDRYNAVMWPLRQRITPR